MHRIENKVQQENFLKTKQASKERLAVLIVRTYMLLPSSAQAEASCIITVKHLTPSPADFVRVSE